MLQDPLAPFDGRGQELARGLASLRGYYPGQVSVAIGLQDICGPLLGSDVFLMPSLYEPGGISQLEALACGCLVVARATGGLQDTVAPLAGNGRRMAGNGFLFSEPTGEGLYDAIVRCVRFFRETDEELIEELRRKARHSLHYWDQTARLYLEEVYSTQEVVRVEPDSRCTARSRAGSRIRAYESASGEGEKPRLFQVALQR